MMMITTIFTYFGYYAHKATIKDDWPTKYVADDINDDLKYNYSQFTLIVLVLSSSIKAISFSHIDFNF